ncbi:hypothetical protein AB1Y20_002219 [Prymnesium parvum]|uniref:Thiopurine S-methyltransferase n=1 Tax=Prymnesium parvum TaxID=97485 RepID=A0AB34J8I2_PRYPA
MAHHAGATAHWESLWSSGLQPGQLFDVGGASPTLLGCLSRGNYAPRRGMKAFVPGCGRAYDALALAKHGFDEVVALDLSPTAVEAARDFVAASSDEAASKVRCETGDFFAHEAQYDFIWDCTFLCALDPTVREQWAARHRQLLTPEGVLASCVFPICDKEGGPPFALSPELVRGLLEPTGLKCEVVEVPQSEYHQPPGSGSLTASTALLLARP